MTDIMKKMEEYTQQLKIKEEQQKAEEEAKLLATPIEKLIPVVYEDSRVTPNAFLRSGLFGMVKKGKRALVENQVIISMPQYEVKFSGSELDQNDLELWDILLYLAKQRMVDNVLRITLYDLCKQMNLSYSTINRKALIKRVERLKFAMIKIKADKKIFFGSLINNGFVDENGDGKLVIEYNKTLMPLFVNKDYSFRNATIIHELGDQLSKWLYNFYCSHKEPIPFKLDYLQKLCRSQTEPKEFKRLLKHALENIKQTLLKFDEKSKFEWEIKDNSLYIYKNGKPEEPQKLLNDMFKGIVKIF